MAIKQPKRRPATIKDYSPHINRGCPFCSKLVAVFDNYQDWKLGQNGCGGRYD